MISESELRRDNKLEKKCLLELRTENRYLRRQAERLKKGKPEKPYFSKLQLVLLVLYSLSVIFLASLGGLIIGEHASNILKGG